MGGLAAQQDSDRKGTRGNVCRYVYDSPEKRKNGETTKGRRTGAVVDGDGPFPVAVC